MRLKQIFFGTKYQQPQWLFGILYATTAIGFLILIPVVYGMIFDLRFALTCGFVGLCIYLVQSGATLYLFVKGMFQVTFSFFF